MIEFMNNSLVVFFLLMMAGVTILVLTTVVFSVRALLYGADKARIIG